MWVRGVQRVLGVQRVRGVPGLAAVQEAGGGEGVYFCVLNLLLLLRVVG